MSNNAPDPRQPNFDPPRNPHQISAQFGGPSQPGQPGQFNPQTGGWIPAPQPPQKPKHTGRNAVLIVAGSVVALIVLIIIAGSAGGGGATTAVPQSTTAPAPSTPTAPKHKAKSASKPKPAPKPKPAHYTSVSAVDLFNAYDSNPAVAGHKYGNGKKLKITGTITDISADLLDDSAYDVDLGTSNDFMSVTVDGLSNSEVAKLSKGDQITVVAEVTDGDSTGLGVTVQASKLVK